MPELPTGTVTFVFSDIEGSTGLLRSLGDEGYAALLATHRRLVRATFGGRGGLEIDTQGDAFFYSFTRARAAVSAAITVQRAHAAEKWPDGLAVRIRLGLHTGEPQVGEEGYAGLDVVRASRIAALGRGGQVLLSETTRSIVAGDLPSDVEVRPLGEQKLKGIDRPEPVYELVIEGVAVSLATAAVAPAAAGAPPGDLIEAALPRDSVPEWVRGAAARLLPGDLPIGVESHRLIEERVVGQLERAFRDRDEARQRKRQARRGGRAESPATGSPSVADEIAKLRALRDSGALTDEQYERAVERALGG